MEFHCKALHPLVLPIRIGTLGVFEVTRGGVTISEKEWRRPVVKRLFKFLLINRNKLLMRGQVLEYLWPHLPPPAAENNLRVSLAVVRKVLQEHSPLIPLGRLNISREFVGLANWLNSIVWILMKW